jgi:AcrR family transcriptional regulator
MGKPAKKRKAAWEDMMKQSIFEATVTVIKKHGPGGIRMDRVAKAAEMATGTLYNYFKDKDALLLHVKDTLFAPYHEKLRDIVAGDMSPPDKLEAHFRLTFRHLSEQRDILSILIQAKDLGLKSDIWREPEMDFRIKIIRLICKIIEEGITKGVFRGCDALGTASMIFGAVTGFIDSKITGLIPERAVKEDVENCMALILPGLLAAY